MLITLLRLASIFLITETSIKKNKTEKGQSFKPRSDVQASICESRHGRGTPCEEFTNTSVKPGCHAWSAISMDPHGDPHHEPRYRLCRLPYTLVPTRHAPWYSRSSKPREFSAALSRRMATDTHRRIPARRQVSWHPSVGLGPVSLRKKSCRPSDPTAEVVRAYTVLWRIATMITLRRTQASHRGRGKWQAGANWELDPYIPYLYQWKSIIPRWRHTTSISMSSMSWLKSCVATGIAVTPPRLICSSYSYL